jgi:hypothetical protein
LVGKPEGQTPLGRPRRRWEDNIKMDRKEIMWEGVNWIGVALNGELWRAYNRVNATSEPSVKYCENYVLWLINAAFPITTVLIKRRLPNRNHGILQFDDVLLGGSRDK